jgi:hypothetical protein
VIAAPELKAGQLLFTPPGAPLTPTELEQLRAAQQVRNRRVVERAPGIYAVEKLPNGR